MHTLFSVTAFLGNSLILVSLHKESSLHPPSKLLYRCLATTDLLVGLVAQPLYATLSFSYSWSLEDRRIFYYTNDAVIITSHMLCGVSLLTMTAISVDRLLALLLGLRYRQIVTLKRTYIILANFWVLSLVASLSTIFKTNITFSYGRILILVCYAPYGIVEIMLSKTYSWHFREITIVLVYFNSTLNPFLYCWKISEVRRAVKQTIRQALCCL